MARGLKLTFGAMQSRAEHTRLSAGREGVQGRHDGAIVGGRRSGKRWRDGESRVFPLVNYEPETPRVGQMPMRRIPVIPAHLPMAAARKVATLQGIALLLVEREDLIVGAVDESALASADDQTPVVAAMRRLSLWLRPTMSAAQARELFVRARTNVLPVIAGGFVLGAITRGDIERTKP